MPNNKKFSIREKANFLMVGFFLQLGMSHNTSVIGNKNK